MSGERKVLVTGGTGFVGQALLTRLAARPDLELLAWVRQANARVPSGVISVQLPDGATATGAQLEGLQIVIHCAARVHVMDDKASDALTEFRKVNVGLTLECARMAVEAGAKRFIFLSSIKVNGEGTRPGHPFTVNDAPKPDGPYAQSKYEAEIALRKLSEETGLEVVIIRTPLVYGPGVRANFRSMMRWLSMGLPLPLGNLDNRRSLVALDNLVDLIETCIDHPAAANRTLMVSDGEDLSTSALLQRLGVAMGRPARLLPVPEGWIERIARLLGRESIHSRLCGSLQVDINETRELLGWTPPVQVDEALMRTAEDYLSKVRP